MLKIYTIFFAAIFFSFNSFGSEIIFESDVSKVCGFESVDSTAVIFDGEKGRSAKIIAINNDKEKNNLIVTVDFISYDSNGFDKNLIDKNGDSLFKIEVMNDPFGGDFSYPLTDLDKKQIDFPILFDESKKSLYVNIYPRDDVILESGHHEIHLDFQIECG